MSLGSRRLDHIRDVACPEQVSPLESPSDASVQDHLHSNITVSGHEDILPHSLSRDSFTTLQNVQSHDERAVLPASPPRRLLTDRYISTGHPLNRNLWQPSPPIPTNLDNSHPILENGEPIKRKFTQTRVPPSKPSFSWWWWWEISAMMLSIASMSLIALLLSKINGIPLEAWGLPITPQSLIAILTTAGKTALLVPIASCIGQLKWRHFTRQPRKLIDLQHFDDASRGPWGSTLLFYHLAFRARLLVTLGFAIVTVLALGIDPSAQQIIKFPAGESQLGNVSVLLGTADMYYSKGFLENTGASQGTWQPNSNLLALQSSIVNGATGSVFQPYFNCPGPASRCTWDSFTTIGVCAEFKDVSREAVAHCTAPDSVGTINCTYSAPGMDFVDTEKGNMVMQWNTEIGKFLAVKALGDGYPQIKPNATGGYAWAPPDTEVYYATFSWCAKTFQNVSASQKHLDIDPITSEALIWANVVWLMDEGNLMGTNYYTYTSNTTGSTFNISEMVIPFLSRYLRTLLTTTVYHNIYRPDIGPTDELLEVGFAIMNLNLSDIVSNIADTLTNQIRSNNPGDNYNATVTKGDAFFDEPYIEVRWIYLALPFAVTLFSAVLLIITIIITDKQPLLKNSSIALLVHRLQGWGDEELDRDGPQTQEKLDHIAGSMVARLEDDENGRMKLVRKKLD
ncbi:hypothetical protein GGR58DRAFT_513265 [Xylaria digitata]|nr:hypothetical protein GGR58DRAFT_513265 [Xylaria digitata]